MTTTENKGADAGPAVSQFMAFRWTDIEPNGELLPAVMLSHSVETTRNLAGGLGVVLAMLEREEIDRGMTEEDGTPMVPIFTGPDRGELLRMCIGICHALRDGADSTLDRVSDYRAANNGGRS